MTQSPGEQDRPGSKGAVEGGEKSYGVRVLMIDDQPRVSEAIAAMLAGEENLTFRYCRDPREAVNTALAFEPTVILQDLVMPEMEGNDLTRLFKAHPRLRDIPLIVLSSREEGLTKAQAFASGADDYIVKLPDKVELVARVLYHSRSYINLLQKNEVFDALVQSQEALALEVERATAYVRTLLPTPIGEGPVRTEWFFRPCDNLGGDSLGYHWIDERHFAMYLLDVSGHGIGSSLLSVSALNMVRGQTLGGTDFTDPGSVLGALNKAFQMKKHYNLYFTMWYGVFDAGSSRLAWAGAGHPPPLLFEPGERGIKLESDNGIIGMHEKASYGSESMSVRRPASLYVFSDGVFEICRPDGTAWSYRDLRQFIAGNQVPGGTEPGALYRHAVELHGDLVLEDDFSILKVLLC